MFKKILIANRGEIAVRIVRACRELGIISVAVYSDVDRASLHVRLADEAYAIGPAASRESYLRIDKLLDIAKRAGCDALHPGYGFLAENPHFADVCRSCNIEFIGPSHEAMAMLGDKLRADFGGWHAAGYRGFQHLRPDGLDAPGQITNEARTDRAHVHVDLSW